MKNFEDNQIELSNVVISGGEFVPTNVNADGTDCGDRDMYDTVAKMYIEVCK